MRWTIPRRPWATHRTLMILILAALASSGCSEDETSSDVEQFAGRTPVVGTETCQRTVDSDEVLDDGSEVMLETFTCDLEMSDPRASGLDVWHIESTFLELDDVTVAATGEGTLTNDEGSWTATGEFVAVIEGGWPTNYGEEVYVGQGAYEGLTLNVLIAGSNEQLTYAGWIEGSS